MNDDDDCPVLVSAKVPVTILTGFLGSGKTTLLHHILTVDHGLKIAVIVNEFEFGKSIEKGLTLKSTQKADDEWLELNNGCMCCTSQSQTVLALENLMRKKQTFDLVLVETSGMADPGPIAEMFWQDEALCGTLFLSGIVTLVDAKHIMRHLTSPDTNKEAMRQILAADKIILNKIDLITEKMTSPVTDDHSLLSKNTELKELISCITDINPTAELMCAIRGVVVDMVSGRVKFPADNIRITSSDGPHTAVRIVQEECDDNNTSNSGGGIDAVDMDEGEHLRKLLFINTTKVFNFDDVKRNDNIINDSNKQDIHGGGISAVSFEISNASFLTVRDIDLLCRDLLYIEGGTNNNNNTGDDIGDPSSLTDGHHQYHPIAKNNSTTDSFEIIRLKAAVWVKSSTHSPVSSTDGVQNTTQTDDMALYQIQSICEIFDVTPMVGQTVPHRCNRFLVLGRRLDETRLRSIVSRYIQC
eukprot:Tbor_TRINITY_DN6677_c0_g1::TRINITY_DN6677_c0_g1_i1::g.3072::m.3072